MYVSGGSSYRSGWRIEDIAKRYPEVLGEVRGWGLLKGVAIKEDAGCTAAELVGYAMKESLVSVAPVLQEQFFFYFIQLNGIRVYTKQ